MITKKKSKGNSRSVYFKESYLWEKLANEAADQKRSVNNLLEIIAASYLLEKSLKK